MPQEPKVRWDKNARAWRSDVGPRGVKGRRKPVYFRTDGAGHELAESNAGARAARKLLAEYLARRDEDEAAGRRGLEDPSVEQVRLLWLSHVKRAGTPGTYHVSRSTVGQFCAFTHQGVAYRDRRAAGLTTTDLTRFLNAKRAAGRKPHYLAKLAGVVQSMLNWAANPQPERTPERLLPGGNPLRGMEAPAVPDSPERFAEVGEIAAFLAAWRAMAAGRKRGGRMERFDRLAALLVRCLVQTGARPGEFCKAQWDDVTWEAGVTAAGHPFGKVVLPPERWKAGRKTGKSRTVFLTPVLTRALRREFARPDRHPTHLFFHARKRAGEGGPTDPWESSALGRKVRKVRRAAGGADEGPNRMVAYLFRHTAASRALMKGMDPVTVAALLGTSPNMLRKHYGHLLDDHLKAAAEALAGARRGKLARG
jgi:integrase